MTVTGLKPDLQVSGGTMSAMPPAHMSWSVVSGSFHTLHMSVSLQDTDILDRPYITGYAFLLAYLAHIMGYDPGELHMNYTNPYVYADSLDEARALSRSYYQKHEDFPGTELVLPRLQFKDVPKFNPATFDYSFQSLTPKNFGLNGGTKAFQFGDISQEVRNERHS
jgi:hypothetical protein